MGSSGTRKSNDVVRINLPKGSGSEAGASGTAQSDINMVCPLKFRIKIDETNLAVGSSVNLVGDEMFVSGQLIGKISTSRSNQINECAGKGIIYSASLEKDSGGNNYVQFQQKKNQ
jgi:hypothetical protein